MNPSYGPFCFERSGWVTKGKKSGGAMEIGKIAILGGDLRTVYLANALHKTGYTVSPMFLEDSGRLSPQIKKESLVQDALNWYSTVVLPVPVLKEGRLNAPLWHEPIELCPLLEQISACTLVLGGLMPQALRQRLDALQLPWIDILEREELIVDNAAYTAEGALAVAMAESPRSILSSRGVVVGYGHIGRILARYLAALGAHVTVTARRPEHYSWIYVEGYTPWPTEKVGEVLSQADFVFNTVPHLVLGEEALSKANHDAVYIDLASRPGGIDFDYAAKAGLKTVWALSLPGKVNPKSAGESIAVTIQNILEERRVAQ